MCSMWQKMESFNKGIINCKSSFKDSTLGEKLSEFTLPEIQTTVRDLLNGERPNNGTLAKLFTGIKGQSQSVAHSNEAALFARHIFIVT